MGEPVPTNERLRELAEQADLHAADRDYATACRALIAVRELLPAIMSFLDIQPTAWSARKGLRITAAECAAELRAILGPQGGPDA